MLNLLQIADLDIRYDDQTERALAELSDVIRSLSTTVTDQNDTYVQRYISLQTFGNNGEESTSETRRGNAVANIIQAYRAINIHDVINRAFGIKLTAPDNFMGVVNGNRRFNFGFNGTKLMFGTGSLGKEQYYKRSNYEFKRPNCEILNANFQHNGNLYTIGKEFSTVLLFPDGTTRTKHRYVWFLFSEYVDHDVNGYYVDTNVVTYDFGTPGVQSVARWYETRHAYTQSPVFVDNLLEAMRVCANEYQLAIYAEPSSPQGLTYKFDADSTSHLYGNSFLVDWMTQKAILPLPNHQDYAMNSPAGIKAESLEDMPGMIVGWIRNNS